MYFSLLPFILPAFFFLWHIFHCKIQNPSFVSLIKSSIYLAFKIFIAHFYHSIFKPLFVNHVSDSLRGQKLFHRKTYTHLFSLWSNLSFIQHPQYSLLISTIQSLYPFFFSLQINRLFNSHHFVCMFHFFHTFYAHLFFFYYELLHPSFFCLIKSTLCSMCRVFITHFYHLFFTLEIYRFSNSHYDRSFSIKHFSTNCYLSFSILFFIYLRDLPFTQLSSSHMHFSLLPFVSNLGFGRGLRRGFR